MGFVLAGLCFVTSVVSGKQLLWDGGGGGGGGGWEFSLV